MDGCELPKALVLLAFALLVGVLGASNAEATEPEVEADCRDAGCSDEVAPPAGEEEESSAEASVYPAAAVADLETRSGYEAIPQVGGPTSTGVMLVRSDLDKDPAVPMPGWSDRLADRWFASKERLLDNHGLAFGLSYNVLGQTYLSADTLDAAGGIFDAALLWTPIGRGSRRSGTLVLLAEHQHKLGTALAPEAAGIAAGSAIPTASFGDFGWHLNNLHWSQQLAGDSLILVAGVVDTIDYVDYHSLNDPLTAFSSYAFAGTPTIPLPDPGFGFMLRAATEQFYLSAGIADGNARAGDLDAGGFFEDPAHFTHVELGTTPSFGQRLVENLHLTLWHQAARAELDVPEDFGGAMTLSTRLTERASGFFRTAVSRGRTTALESSVSLGGAYSVRSFDLLGMGLSWGKTAATGRNQLTFETFYRFQFGPVSTLTPHLQVILDPALEPDSSSLVVLGLRVRIAL